MSNTSISAAKLNRHLQSEDSFVDVGGSFDARKQTGLPLAKSTK